MNTRSFVCLFLLLLLSIHVPSFGAFPVSKVATAAPAHPGPSIFQHLAAPEKQRNVNGTFSLVFGVAGLVLSLWGGGLYFGIPALIFGNAGIRNKERYANAGKGLAIASIVITCLVFLIVLVALSLYFAGGL